MENRHWLIVDGMATTADGHAERDAALLLLQARAQRPRPRTVGADKHYGTRDFVDVTRQLGYTPHVSQNVKRPGGSAIDRRTTRDSGRCAPPNRARSSKGRCALRPSVAGLQVFAGGSGLKDF